MPRSFRTLAAALAAAIGLAGCTVHKQSDAPPLTGPSETALSLTVTVSPDVLTQDGQSQSLVTVQAFGPNGQPQRSVPLRAEIVVGGASTDFGSLSARNIVTDANGRATVTYTAPPPPVLSNDPGTVVHIQMTPVGSDFANSNSKNATIRLVPPGIIGPPLSTLRPDFAVPGATQGNPAVFTAVVVDAAGNDATGQVTSYQWNFGDGGAGSGQSTSHTFDSPGTFAVTLTVTDTLGRIAQTTHSLTISQGVVPTATFLFSPQAPIVNQVINFNASGSQAEPGHRITDYSWNFGDGNLGSGPLVTHTYSVEGTYVVTLKTTDDAGRKSTLATATLVVTNDQPRGTFTFSPTSPSAAAGSFASVTFDATQITAVPGRTIVSYAWDFGDGTTGAGATISHSFLAGTTHLVILRVTDSAGASKTISQSVTVGST